MAVHYFEVDEAVKYGTNPAILLYNIRFWLEKNKANNKNIHDGYFWTYNSAEAFENLFPYMKRRSIANYITKLCDEGALLVGKYNETKYDQTQWYTIPSEFGVNSVDGSNNTIGKICQSKGNNFNSNGKDCKSTGNNCKPIPDNKQQIVNTDSKQNISAAAQPAQKKKLSESKKVKESITSEWTPSVRCLALLGNSGIDSAFAHSLVEEFILYWEERGDKRAGWDATFLGFVKRESERKRPKSYQSKQPGQRPIYEYTPSNHDFDSMRTIDGEVI